LGILISRGVVEVIGKEGQDIQRHLIRGLLLTSLLFVATLGCYGFFYEPDQVEVHRVSIRDTPLAKILEGETVVQLSDLHIAKIGRREKKVLRILGELRPDFIFLTGDYVSWKGDYQPALTFLSKLTARMGVWGILGDYDLSDSRKSCLFCHEPGSGQPTHRHRIRFLRDSFQSISLPKGSFSIGGTDIAEKDLHSFGDELRTRAGKEPAIILSHNPMSFPLFDKKAGIVVLAGDTHGGQIPLPSWLWSLLGYEKCARFSQGVFENGRNKMFVTRGIGTSHVPIRILRRPEVVVLHFEPE
jgi:predicted MPP superfamily phosphohydrolase